MSRYWIHPYVALRRLSKSFPDRVAFSFYKIGNQSFEKPLSLTWKQVFDRVLCYRQFLFNLGLKRGDRIALKGHNGPEWILLDWASMISGLVTVPLYNASPDSEISVILEESEAKYIFVDQIQSFVSIPQIDFAAVEAGSGLLSPDKTWEPFEDPDGIATIIYTSGTQGKPKGVVHTFRNLSESFLRANEIAKMTENDRMISYLPLSHVAERVLVGLGSLYSGAHIVFLDRVERLAHALPQIRPTVFLAVPRVWDMFRFKIERELQQNKILQERLSLVPGLVKNWLVGKLVRRKIGLDKSRLNLSGAAKLGAETMMALQKLGIKIHECYGLTETLCVSTVTRPGKIVMGSCGRTYRGVDCRIEGDGEILLRAGFHFKGYYKEPALTAEVLTDGWFRTGDIGHLDNDGNLFITDRKKNLFKTSGGKYVAPLVGETLLKSHPSVREALVIGEERPHCIALLNVDMTQTSEDDLRRLMERVNSKLPAHEHIKTIGVVAKAWTVDSGELTASYKLKRKVILEKYREAIEQLYETRAKVVLVGETQTFEEGLSKRAHFSVK